MLLSLVLAVSGISLAPQAPPIDFTKFKPYTAASDLGDYLIEPPYRDAPELTPSAELAKGKTYRFVMKSTESKIYSGIAKNAPGQVVPYNRNVTVYVPATIDPAKPSPFLISQDSMGRGEIPTILDRLIASKELPPMVAIFIDSGGGDAQGSQRGLEYDTVSGVYADFVESEVLPRVSAEAGVTLSKNPDARMTMGGSSGGACAFSMAWWRPNLYHRVLSYSGTFVDQQSPENPVTPNGAWEYHQRLIAESRRKPLRIWLHVSEQDNRWNDPEETLHNWPLSNVRMAAALAAKRYPYQFVFSKQSGHVDWRVVRQTLPQALRWVWKGYRSR